MDTTDSGDVPEEPPQVNTASVEVVIKYVKSVVACVLEEDSVGSSILRESFSGSAALDLVRRFINDAQVRALLVSKSFQSEAEAEDAQLEGRYDLKLDVQYVDPRVTSVTFIKRGYFIEAEKKVAPQLRVINLENAAPFETLHSYISNAVAPYFKSYVKASGKSAR